MALFTGIASAATQPLWMFHDGSFKWGGHWSFNAQIDFSDRSGSPLDGKRDIKVVVSGQWGGFQPYFNGLDVDLLDLSPYAYLTFALKTTEPAQQLQVYFEGARDTSVGTAVDPFKYGPAAVVGVWQTYTIPLADFGVTGKRIKKFAIQDETGRDTNIFYLNDVGFLPAGSVSAAQSAHQP